MRVLPLSVTRDYAWSDVIERRVMFAKRPKPPSQREPATGERSQTAQSGPEALDATIERLQRELAEQREAANALRESLDAATFKTEILENSYAKQLAEVRDKLAATESELKEKDEILSNLGGGHEHTLRELNDALTVIKVLKKERDQLRKQMAQGGFRERSERGAITKARALLGDDARGLVPAPPSDDTGGGASGVSDDDTSGTINALIANAGWTSDNKSGVGAGQATAQVEATQEPQQEEMLSPDLVFTEKDEHSDR